MQCCIILSKTVIYSMISYLCGKVEKIQFTDIIMTLTTTDLCHLVASAFYV